MVPVTKKNEMNNLENRMSLIIFFIVNCFIPLLQQIYYLLQLVNFKTDIAVDRGCKI
jgi:hypothetical protein